MLYREIQTAMVEFVGRIISYESVRNAIALSIVVLIWRGIPWYMKKRSGQMKRDSDDRDKSREQINQHTAALTELKKILPVVEATEKHLKEMNGSVRDHLKNDDIHIPREKLMMDPLLVERHEAAMRDREEIKLHMDTRDSEVREMVNNIFARINDVAAAKGL